MKNHVLSFLSIFLMIILFSSSHTPTLFKISKDCDSIPELNQQIINFVKSKINKKVGRGECWDLAAEPLKLYHAKWDGKYQYGRKVSHLSECVYPGDIIQLEGVKIKYIKNNIEYTEKMGHHTAIIYEVKGSGEYILAHQNTGYSGRKVGLSPLNLKDITKGKYVIYRPEYE